MWSYSVLLGNDEVFDDCPDQPNGVLNIQGLFDFSELKFDLEVENVFIEGKATTVWDVQPTDIIQAQFELLHFERGSWNPTIYTLNIPDFCSIMWDKNQHWYKTWLHNVENANAIKLKCLRERGTKFVHKRFQMDFIFESHLSDMDGIYKVRATFKALNPLLRTMRPTSICVEIKVEFLRL
ncbi:uncharacterized protein LOC117789559 [Drosophila innubila]|uniref:uncharacterized protein LOC117789559 n=1 Tax=Drosophila innubila TaxID=198719 RepID=UPI00148D5B76|nr:uncharacterized protein LOC117789559 [Drosophila innubila]